MAGVKSNPLALVCGDDDFAVKQRARQLFQQWSAELGGMDHETIEAGVGNSGDALKVIGQAARSACKPSPFSAAARWSGCATAIFWAKTAPPHPQP